jgi:hypothetical protein
LQPRVSVIAQNLPVGGEVRPEVELATK